MSGSRFPWIVAVAFAAAVPLLSHAAPRADVATLTVRITSPADVRLPEGTLLLLGTREDLPIDFMREQSRPLEWGAHVFPDVSRGWKRLRIVDTSGATLLYENATVDHAEAMVEIAMAPLRVHGRITSRNLPVPGVRIDVADPFDPSVLLARATSDADGRYAITTWKRGELAAYAIENNGPGRSAHATSEKVVVDAAAREQEVNFELPSGGLTLLIVDALSGDPVAGADVGKRIRSDDGFMEVGHAESDANGTLTLTHYPAGAATLRITAKGYRVAEVQEPIAEGAHPLVRLALQRAHGTGGRVVGCDGVALAGAVVTDGSLRTTTDDRGRFRFDADPIEGTPFYVVARGHALAVSTLRAAPDNEIRLEPVTDGVLRILMQDGTPPAAASPARRTRRRSDRPGAGSG